MSKPKNIKNCTETGVCDHHNCDHQEKEVSKCRHCGRSFCEEHIKPIIPSIDGFSNHNDWKVTQGHGCSGYTKYLENEKHIQFEKEINALNILTGKFSKVIDDNTFVSDNIDTESVSPEDKKREQERKIEEERLLDEDIEKRERIIQKELKIEKRKKHHIKPISLRQKLKSENKRLKRIEEERLRQERLRQDHKPIKQKSNYTKSEDKHNSRYITITIDFYAIIDKIKCFFGFHRLEKYMGPENYGNGRIRQRYICKRCRKIKEVIY